MSDESFYSALPILDDFSATSDFSRYSELPEDWQIVVADIEDSTAAIAAGHYKAVNLLGVSVITAIINLTKPQEIPSIFGGDGAALCIPEKFTTAASRSLLAVKKLALEQYDLNLRVGIVPVAVINNAGLRVMVARHRMSEHFVQSAFAGGGIDYAENLLKHAENGKAYRLEDQQIDCRADYSGLECRWNKVPSKHGEIIALIVKALASDKNKESAVYRDIIKTVEKIYGADDQSRPVTREGLQLTIFERQLDYESSLKTFECNKLDKFKFFLKIRFETLLGALLMRFSCKTGDTDWGLYKKEVVENTDFKKFDGTLRQILSGSEAQRLKLDAYLRKKFEQGDCVYGIHASDSALVTCLVGSHSGAHFHYVDGSNGGYAMAASAMKEQLRSLPTRKS